MNKILEMLLIMPHVYLIIELIYIENKWGISAINNFSGISIVIILLTVIFIPVLCSLCMHGLIKLVTKHDVLTRKQE